MTVRAVFVLAVLLALGAGCLPAPTPTPAPTPIPAPTATVPAPTGLLPTAAGNHSAPVDVPACQDAQAVQGPIQFAWVGLEDISQNAPETNWVYYHCKQSPVALAAFYRRWMPAAQYHWAEIQWEQRDATTLGIFFSNTGNPADPNRWLYLWFLPDSSAGEFSYLAAVWWIAPKSC